MSRRSTATLLAVLAFATAGPLLVEAQQKQSNDEFARRARSKVQPSYPELALKMKIVGTVKVEVVVSPGGVVKEARVLGGHPVLASVALDAARKWRFEAAPVETTGVIEFRFEPR